MNKEKILIIVFSIIIIASVTISIMLVHQNNTKKNETINELGTVNEDFLLKESTIDGLKISNIVIMVDETNSSYKAKVTNTTNDTYHIDKLYITFTIKDQEYSITGLSNTDIAPNESKYITINIDQDLSKASKIDYKLNS